MIVNERIGAYIFSLEKEPPKFLKEIEEQALADNVPIIKKATQSLLRFLLTNNKPENILEVGAAVGFSSILMSEYMPDTAHITTIEKMPSRIEKAKENIRSAGRESKITLLEGDAIDILKELTLKEGKYDFMFMDAAKGQYINFLPEIMKLLPVGGLLVSDNVLQDGDIVQSRYGVTRRNRTIHSRMREYLYTLTHMDEFDTIVLPIGDGVTLSTRVK
ncbi:O-methyltransferase [Anaeromicropila herbilytica]|uniref:tRNA 5-hydroxyuridine methyltransferase n=1 Tax=Anaeromicropila herbilytica TaxID=2785025 RepID=A0A7R7EN79_9FIRM|nr:O-methyltransferase [Anaeromicropila herbilytica]BCN31711.1 O-methyltransferase [Anaeromicropila herbilytica]